LRALCETLAEEFRRDADLVERVIAECRRWIDHFQIPDPSVVDRLRATLAANKRETDLAFELVRDAGSNIGDLKERLTRLRAEKQGLEAELSTAIAATVRVAAVPTSEEVRGLLDGWADALVTSSDGSAEDAAYLRAVIDLVTGGRIDLEQAGERRSHGGHLVGRFRLRVVRAMLHHYLDASVTEVGEGEREVVIEFSRDYSRIPADKRNRVIELYQGNHILTWIAAEVGVHRKSVAEIVKAWHVAQGLSLPDAYARRKQCLVKQSKPTKSQRLAEDVYAAVGRGDTVVATAARLDISEPTVHAAWAYWHQSRGLPPITIRESRKEKPPEADAA
jgi:hypothetical protein